MRKNNRKLNKQEIFNVIQDYKKGELIKDLAIKHNHSNMVINGIICYYNDRKNRVSDLLSDKYKSLIDEIKDNNQVSIIKKEYPKYEAKIFFGLIKIVMNPIIVEDLNTKEKPQ